MLEHLEYIEYKWMNTWMLYPSILKVILFIMLWHFPWSYKDVSCTSITDSKLLAVVHLD